jgi:hypothetical protein
MTNTVTTDKNFNFTSMDNQILLKIKKPQEELFWGLSLFISGILELPHSLW